MSQFADPELLQFAMKVIEKQGGVTEQHEDISLSLLPEKLAQKLELPEEVVIGSEKAPLMYGHPLLDRLIEISSSDVPVLYAKIDVPYLKKGGFEQLIASEFNFQNGKCRIMSTGETRTNYMLLYCRYLALSDQRKEGLIRVAVHENSGVFISNFENRLDGFQIEYLTRDQKPVNYPPNPEMAITSGLKQAQGQVNRELQDFIKSIRRHLNRDVKNTREYYEALKKEMNASLQRTNLSQAQITDRKGKIKDLPNEMERKIADLKQKYRIEINFRISAVIRFLLPVTQLSVELAHRKIRRNLFLRFNPVTHHLDPFICEQCRRPIYEIHPVPKNGTLLLKCANCHKQATA